jgi:gamma-glutamyl-gamma-aminobutyrate hydrolase PuuD
MNRAPRIVVTLAAAEDAADADLARRRNDNYVAAVERHGAVAVRLTVRTPPAQRDAALATMDGLLFSGGADVDPARYGQAVDGATEIDEARDALEAGAWAAAESRGVPVLGICRGLQAINVFSGGTLLQHVEGHAGAAWGSGPTATHPIRLVAGTRLAAVLGPDEEVQVNAYHHQAIRAGDLAPALRAAAWAESAAGPLVEGAEAADGRFVVGVQCHPERTESTPEAFERLFGAFVEAAREQQTQA